MCSDADTGAYQSTSSELLDAPAACTETAWPGSPLGVRTPSPWDSPVASALAPLPAVPDFPCFQCSPPDPSAGVQAPLGFWGPADCAADGDIENFKAPLGFWDPADYTADGDIENFKAPVHFKRRCNTEIKHGRTSMHAALGYVLPEITSKLPGSLSFPAFDFAALCEVPLDQFSPEFMLRAPGDFGFKALVSSDPAQKPTKLTAKLMNGRLAMMAITGMFLKDGLGYITPEYTGKLPGYPACSQAPAAGRAQIIAHAAYCEASLDQYSPELESRASGDLGLKALASSDPVETITELNDETANSRLAMKAITSESFRDGLTGPGPPSCTSERSAMPLEPGAPDAAEDLASPFERFRLALKAERPSKLRELCRGLGLDGSGSKHRLATRFAYHLDSVSAQAGAAT